MKTIKRLFREVRMETAKVAFLNSFLNASIVFFLLYLIFIFVDYNYLYSLIPALVFFVADFAYWQRYLDLQTVEEANPEVREILRTAYDYKDEKNVLVLGMFYDLVQNMQEVSAGNLLDSSTLFKKTVAISLLTFAVVVVASLEIYLGGYGIGFGGPSEKLQQVFGGSANHTQAGKGNKSIESIGFNKTQGLYGKSNVAKLGKEQLNLNINPSKNSLNFDKQKSLEQREFSKKSYPSNVAGKASDYSGSNVPDEAELAKAYNRELRR